MIERFSPQSLFPRIYFNNLCSSPLFFVDLTAAGNWYPRLCSRWQTFRSLLRLFTYLYRFLSISQIRLSSSGRADKHGPQRSSVLMHSIADLRCIQCHVNHMTLDAPNQNNRPVLPFVGRTDKYCGTYGGCSFVLLLHLIWGGGGGGKWVSWWTCKFAARWGCSLLP